MKKKQKQKLKKIALERIYRLFELAEQSIQKEKSYSKELIELAKRIGKKYNVRIPKELKIKYCKKCNLILLEGINARIRIKKPYYQITCLECKKTTKHRIISKKRK